MRLSAKSQTLFDKALQWIPGGVNSPVRAFRAVGGKPFFAVRAKGASVWDADENEYVDYVGTWGPAILGHAPQIVIDAVKNAAERLSAVQSRPSASARSLLAAGSVPFSRRRTQRLHTAHGSRQEP